MAKTTTVSLTDDLDGSKAERTVAFGLSGSTYEIDLSKKNATALEKVLAPYLQAARKAAGGPARAGSVRRSVRARRMAGSAKPDVSAVRAWAKDNGYEVSDRGRIAASVVEAYNASK